MPKIISNGKVVTFPSADQADVEVDTTLIKAEDGMIGVTSPVQRIVTQEEFDSLTEEERNKGLWIIKDGLSGINGSFPTGSPTNTYSTEETVIGTWIDGKPLYRRVYEITTPSKSGVHIVEQFDATIVPKMFNAYQLEANGAIQCPLINVTDNITNFIRIETIEHCIRVNTNSDMWGERLFVGVLEYTKTTD